MTDLWKISSRLLKFDIIFDQSSVTQVNSGRWLLLLFDAVIVLGIALAVHPRTEKKKARASSSRCFFCLSKLWFSKWSHFGYIFSHQKNSSITFPRIPSVKSIIAKSSYCFKEQMVRFEGIKMCWT